MDCVEKHEDGLNVIVRHAVEFGLNMDQQQLLERVAELWSEHGDHDNWLNALAHDRILCQLRRAESGDGIPVLPGEVQGEQYFRQAYERLAAEGKCDSAGGCEYHRVLREWISKGRQEAVEAFIHERANAKCAST